jgi:hypothetical protein
MQTLTKKWHLNDKEPNKLYNMRIAQYVNCKQIWHPKLSLKCPKFGDFSLKWPPDDFKILSSEAMKDQRL